MVQLSILIQIIFKHVKNYKNRILTNIHYITDLFKNSFITKEIFCAQQEQICALVSKHWSREISMLVTIKK